MINSVPSIEALMKAAPALPRQQKKVLYFLSKGQPRSVAEMAATLWLADPRAVIRCLRAKGYPIWDKWQVSQNGSRYKVYYIDSKYFTNI